MAKPVKKPPKAIVPKADKVKQKANPPPRTEVSKVEDATKKANHPLTSDTSKVEDVTKKANHPPKAMVLKVEEIAQKATPSVLAEEESPRSWRWVVGVVGVLLAIHVIVPGMYYFDDSPTARADERFRWRMFSTVRMRRCVAEAFERRARANGVLQQKKISLVREVQYAWINLMHRGRPQVVKAFLRQRCAKKAAEQVEVRQYCRDVKGVPLFVLEWELTCQSGKIRQTYRSLGQAGS